MLVRAVLFGFLSFCLLNPTVSALAQTVTAQPDTAVVATPPANPDADRIIKTEKDKGLSKPGRAALFSAIIPGAGQVYNGHYWKVPIIYAVGGALGYFIVTHNKDYQDYRQAYLYSIDDASAGTTPTLEGKPTNLSASTLLNGRDFYRRNRDLTIILSVLAYGLNVMEANVGAHLNEFDISDDLSLNWQPGLQFSQLNQSPTPGITLNFRFKN
jgi:hypothetical protein